MNILGIETSTRTGGVAVLNENGLVCHYMLSIEVTHSERLMPAVDRVLRDAGISIDDIGGFAVSVGPGSFTGLRVGISTVKGLGFATGRPVAAVPTLKALAWNLYYSAYPVCPLQDAKKGQVYAAMYRYEGSSLIQTMKETVISLKDLFKKIQGTVVFTGEAVRLYRAEIEDALSARAYFAPFSVSLPSAASVAEIGRAMISAGEVTDPDHLTPMYIRRPEAEVAWEKRQRSL